MMAEQLKKPENMNALAHRIASLGYHPVPIQVGRKGPTFANWQNYIATPENIDRDFPATGVVIGCLHDNLGCIDIDVYDADVSKLIADEFRSRFPTALERVGQAPKTAFVFRLPETAYTVSNTGKYSHGGKEGQVEIRTKTGQMVVYGKHPDTKLPYTWPAGDLWETPIDALPMIGEWEVEEFRDWAEEALMDWAGVKTAEQPQQAMIIDFGSYSNGNDGPPSEAAIKDALSYITPHCPHDEWVEVLMALHDYYNGSAAGLSVAQDWSSPHSTYDPKEVASKWKSFKGDGVSYTTLFHHAKMNGADLSELARKHRPQPAVDAMSRQVPAPSVQIDLSNGQSVQQSKVEKPVADYPTEYDMFDGASLPRRQWLYGTHYLRGFVSVMASAGGIGKTSLQIVEALAMVTGKPLLGEVVHETCKVWIINLEDPLEEMQRRIIAAMQHYNIKPEDVKGRLFVDAGRDFSLTFAAQTRDGVIPNEALVDHLIKKIPEREIGMTFIDPFVGAHQVSENDNGAVNDVVAQIRRVADETNSGMGLVHHIRKGNGEDANVDSIRGAGSLIGAARAARVINKITEDEAVRLGVSEKEASGIFRVDDGKANLAPPTHAAVYRKMIGEQIPNGEWVGVAIEYKMPDEWAGMTTEVTNNILRQIDNGLQNQDGEEYFSKNVQAKERWVGNLITSYPFDKAEDHKSQAQAKIILDRWFKEGLLIEETYRSEKRRKDVKGVFTTGRVGEQYVG